MPLQGVLPKHGYFPANMQMAMEHLPVYLQSEAAVDLTYPLHSTA